MTALYVAPGGSDTAGTGSVANPYKTIQKGVTALRGNVIRHLYLESGTYASPAVALTSLDNGITVEADPQLGVWALPILDGGGTTINLMALNGTTGVTVQRLTFQNTGLNRAALTVSGGSGNFIIANHFSNNGQGLLIQNSSNTNKVSGNQFDNAGNGDPGFAGHGSPLEVANSSSGNTVDSNMITGWKGINTQGEGIYLHSGTNNNVITHNLVQNGVGTGIGIGDFGSTPTSGNVISYNKVINSNNSAATNDSGGIYMYTLSNNQTNTLIDHNDVEFPAANPGTSIIGIYLDDNTNGVTVTNNIVRRPNGHCFQIHGGGNNHFTNNICDLGGTTATVFSAILYQWTALHSPATGLNNMDGNVFSKNITVSDQTNSGLPAAFSNIPSASTGKPTMDSNGWDSTARPEARGSWGQGGMTQTNDYYGSMGFTNRSGSDYSITSSVPLSHGFVSIDQSQMGPKPTTDHWYQ